MSKYESSPLFSKTCSIDGCEKKTRDYRKVCRMHNARKTRNGGYDKAKWFVADGDSDLERTLNKFVEDENGCWNWTGHCGDGGYPLYRFKDGSSRVHRWLYEKLRGGIERRLTIDHLCRNIKCINPGHMEPVTMRENLMRGNGPSAINARKTHCKRGHPFSGSNLYVGPNGYRNCRKCNALRVRASRNGVSVH